MSICNEQCVIASVRSIDVSRMEMTIKQGGFYKLAGLYDVV